MSKDAARRDGGVIEGEEHHQTAKVLDQRKQRRGPEEAAEAEKQPGPADAATNLTASRAEGRSAGEGRRAAVLE